MAPLTLADLYDFLYNYIKAEYSPIRSWFSTAAAEPRQQQRWASMGHELVPLSFGPAHAQAQKDLHSLGTFVKEKGLDFLFVKGIVIRFAKFEGHDRMERRLFESGRGDVMVRKAVREFAMIEALWPAKPAPGTAQDLVQQGAKVRGWYGDMFAKYFRYLRAVDDFQFRPEVEDKMRRTGQLNLVPYVDHIMYGDVGTIRPIVARGAGFEYMKETRKRRDRNQDLGEGFGEPDRFEIQFDAPGEIEETLVHSVVRQTSCQKCGTKRDVMVQISLDPAPGQKVQKLPDSSASTAIPKPSNPNTSARRQHSKAAQRYDPAAIHPANDNADSILTPTSPQASNRNSDPASPAPAKQKQCPRCTFLNHHELSHCEMCNEDLPESTLITPPSPPQATEPERPRTAEPAAVTALKRPPPANRHSLSSTLFSIFPFSQAQAQAPLVSSSTHKRQDSAHPTSQKPAKEAQSPPQTSAGSRSKDKPTLAPKQASESDSEGDSPWRSAPSSRPQSQDKSKAAPKENPDLEDDSPWRTPQPRRPSTPHLDQQPEMVFMPLTSPDPLPRDAYPIGMPQYLMDEYVPASPGMPAEEVEDAGWGEMRRVESRKEEDEEDEEERRRKGWVVDSDVDVGVAEERGIWGDGESR
jgi:hypothetical protein